MHVLVQKLHQTLNPWPFGFKALQNLWMVYIHSLWVCFSSLSLTVRYYLHLVLLCANTTLQRLREKVREAIDLSTEPVFLNVYGAQESIPGNEFRQPM